MAEFFRKYVFLIIFLLVLKALYSQDPKPPSNANQIQKTYSNSVKEWMIQEVGVDQTVLNTLGSYELCLIKDSIPLCIKDLLDNTKLPSNLNPSLLHFLQTKSSHNVPLAQLLWKAAQEKKQKLVLTTWLRQNNLLNSNLQAQLKELKIYSRTFKALHKFERFSSVPTAFKDC